MRWERSWLKLHGWPVERRFVVLRERVREEKSAVGRRLIDVPGYTLRIFVTNRSESAEIIWRDYNGRACIEQRIEELKNDLAADGFCVREFFGTESAFLGVLFAFSLFSLAFSTSNSTSLANVASALTSLQLMLKKI